MAPSWLLTALLFAGFCSACEHHHDHHDDDESVHLLRASVTPDESSTTHRHLQDTGEECGFVEPTADELRADAFRTKFWSLRQSNAIEFDYSIPLYMHVIQPSITEDIVPDSNIQVYVNYLNNAFAANTPFRFNLVETTRTVNSVWSNDCRNSTNEKPYKTLLKRGGKETLNVYFCNLVPNGPGKAFLAGYAYLPSQNVGVLDGVVIARTNPTDLRRPNTLVHEVVGTLLGRCKAQLGR
jgi:hypothetical protein